MQKIKINFHQERKQSSKNNKNIDKYPPFKIITKTKYEDEQLLLLKFQCTWNTMHMKSDLNRSEKWGKLVLFTVVAHYHYHWSSYFK